ncbi:dentin sialophosphoprotein [Topomyia yanbarensis]|uniref:dentin sialophosphoprotein n=1 Tax=Topomyia yanbarensis TaxID=2498891 RepID=UPI00273CEF80|nr:dentin sialophosphoprotein [Topomyia yanbarensis]
MGVDTVAFSQGNNQQTNHLFSVNSEYGSPKVPSLVSTTANSKLSSVGIYRPPAVRKALKLSGSAIQLAPPAACEHPNDYSPLSSQDHKQYVTVASAATAPAKPFPPITSDNGASSGSSFPSDGPGTGADTGKNSYHPTRTEEDCDCAQCGVGESLKLVISGNNPTTDASDATRLQIADSNNNNNNSNTEPQQQHQQVVNAAATSQGNQSASSTRPTRSHRERRPDRAVYIPRARRSQTTPPVTASPQQQLQSSASTIHTFCPTADALSPPASAVAPSGCIFPVSFPPKASKKERSSHSSTDKDHKSKAKDKPPPVDSNSVIGSHPSNDCRTDIRSEYSNTVNLSKNRSHSVEKGISTTGINHEIVKLKKQKSEEAPRENAFTQGCDLAPKSHTKKEPKKERSTSSILPEVVNGSTNPKAVDNMNKSNKHRSAKQQSSTTAPLIINGAEASVTADKLDRDEKELRRASQEINRSNRRIIKQTFTSDVLEIAEQESTEKVCSPEQANIQGKSEAARQVNPDEDDWESIYDDNGDCLNPKLMEELTSAVGKVAIEVPRSDYKLYQSKQAALNEEEFPHVLEVSNFPVEFKTQDLMMLFSQYKESGFDIKWVDDTHALAVFSSSKIAAEVLANGHTFVKLKPLAEATVESRSKARKCSSSLQPYRPRPETCAALARRLVTTALGVRLKTAPEERENERRVLREAKERKLLAAKQRDEIWES